MNNLEGLQNESLIGYYCRGAGSTDTMILVILGLISFVVTAAVVFKGKGPTVGPALVLTAPMAAYYGLFSTLNGLMVISRLIEHSGTDPRMNLVVSGLGLSLTAFYMGIVLSMPAFLLAVVGAVTRALRKQTPT